MIAVTIVVMQFALDLYVAQKVKAGHSVGLAAGMLFGTVFLVLNWRETDRVSTKSEPPSVENASG